MNREPYLGPQMQLCFPPPPSTASAAAMPPGSGPSAFHSIRRRAMFLSSSLFPAARKCGTELLNGGANLNA